MIADFFTKPLQGHLFQMFRDVILGYKHVDSLRLAALVPPAERVGKYKVERTVARGDQTTGLHDITGTSDITRLHAY